MRFRSIEKYLDRYKTTVYPITLLKYILNRGQILRYFQKATSPSFTKYFDLDYNNCSICNHKKESEGVMCRPHTTVERLRQLEDGFLYDIDTDVFIYRNEVFKRVQNSNGQDILVVVYCPHTKLISGKITDKKVRKLTPLTIRMDNELKNIMDRLTQHIPKQFINMGEKTNCFSSDALMDEWLGCWFNDEFTIIVYPDEEPDGSRINNNQNWCLINNY